VIHHADVKKANDAWCWASLLIKALQQAVFRLRTGDFLSTHGLV
jgi:hypothetical protein